MSFLRPRPVEGTPQEGHQHPGQAAVTALPRSDRHTGSDPFSAFPRRRDHSLRHIYNSEELRPDLRES